MLGNPCTVSVSRLYRIVSYAFPLTTLTTVDAVEAAFATFLTEEAAAKSGKAGTEASPIL